MPAFTTRMSLYKPGGGSSGTIADEQVDIDKINGNFDVLDAAIGAPGFTSTSRPSTPFDGQFIKETDTRRAMRWSQSGGTWEALVPAYHFTLQKTTAFSFPVGAADHTWDTPLQDGVLEGFSTTDHITFTCTVPGIYLFCLQMTANTGTSNLNLYLYKGAVVYAQAFAPSSTASFTTLYISKSIPFAVGETFKVRNAGSAAINGVPNTGGSVGSTSMSVDYINS